MKVLVAGSGGREHAIGWAFSRDPDVKELFFAPGNGGTCLLGENIGNAKPSDFDSIVEIVQEKEIDIVFCGPEDPLVDGLYDYLTEKGIKTVGPSAHGAKLEGSKAFAKQFQMNMGIPTADYRDFTDPQAATDYINQIDFEPVIKCDGLAAGKGVLLPKTKSEAKESIEQIMVGGKFENAGKRIVIEKRLFGFETTLLSFVDGKTILPMLLSQDYKRAFDHNEGLNTGGMGCLCPSPGVHDELKEEIFERIVKPTAKGLKEYKIPYKGILYFGLIITDDGPFVIEYNVRMGDPESQVVLPLLKTEFSKPVMGIINGNLDKITLKWDHRKSVGVVLASKGYPGSYEKGVLVDYLKNWDTSEDDVFLFHAGTKRDGKNLLTSGGRVACLTALGDSLEECRDRIYGRLKKMELDGLFYRSDIAAEYI
jgi:phosphoribosylamine--glycine ligase